MRPVSVLPAVDPAPLDESLDLETLAGLTKEQLADRLTSWAGRVAAGEARLMAYLGEFDERRGWSGVGMLSCAHWLSWRLGLGLKAASERVRVSRALRELPAIRAAFEAGEISYSQVRALTRISTVDNEHRYLNVARHATGGQLDRLVRGMRRAVRNRERAKARLAGKTPDPIAPQLRTRYDDDGNLLLTLRCTAEDDAILLAALEAARHDLDHPTTKDAADQPDAESSAEDDSPTRAGLSDGLFALARCYLDVRGRQHPGRARRDRARLTVQIDPLTGWARLPDGEFLPPETPGIDLPAGPLRPFTSADLHRHDAGRTAREAPQALRDLLGTLDGERCRYPGCSRSRKLHAHHLTFWADGGRTDLDNLLLLCSRHHTLVHTGGYRLTLDPATRTLMVQSSDGQPIPDRPALPWRSAAELDPDRTITSGTLPPHAVDKLDLHYAVAVLMQWAA